MNTVTQDEAEHLAVDPSFDYNSSRIAGQLMSLSSLDLSKDGGMLEIKNLCVERGAFSVKDITFDVQDEEYFVLVGPTGSGKTVLLETIAGLHSGSSGQVWINGRDVTSFNLQQRRVGFAYQDCAVYGHLSVRDNISFGLMYLYKTKREIDHAVDRAIEVLSIQHLLEKRPTYLSGGETQKIALARAIAIKPDLLLFDEPLSAVDVETKYAYGKELKQLHERLRLPTVHVTHDFEEAMALGDRMAVMWEGRILQIGTPKDVFRHPTSEAVARFLMTRNVFPGAMQDVPGGHGVFCLEGHKLAVATALRGQRHASVRPESISILMEKPDGGNVNILPGTICEISERGSIAYITVDVPPEFTCMVLQPTLEDMGLKEGQGVYITFKASAVNVF
jgi:ABC-type sugar transport system ATPase subunit